MKIHSLVYDLLISEAKSKSEERLEAIVSKWRETYPDLTDEQIVQIFTRHKNLNNVIKNPKSHGVISFLSRHDGQHRTTKYTLADLTQIDKFNITDLIDFLKEFGDLDIDLGVDTDTDTETFGEKQKALERIFAINGNQKTKEKIEESKKMWYNPSTAIVNEDDFRIYPILNQNMSIRMGYYYQTIHRKNHEDKPNTGNRINAPWCVTWRGHDVKEYPEDENGKQYGAPLFSHSGNMYGHYRKNNNRTFYFVIDESKSQTDKYYMSALQIDNNGTYVLSSMFNDGDNIMSWNEISKIYPKITEHRDVIKYRSMDKDELETIAIVDIINETPGNVHEFARQPRNRKDEYVTYGGTIKEMKSWLSMDNELKTKYIDLMDIPNAYNRISNLMLLHEMMNTPGIRAKIEHKLKQLGEDSGVGYFVSNFMKKEFEIGSRSIDNSNIVLYHSIVTKNFGLFNILTLDWVKHDGIYYEPKYKSIGGEVWYGDGDIDGDGNGDEIAVEIFSQTQSPDNSSFRNVVPNSESSSKKVLGFFLSAKKWNELIEKEKLQPTKKKGVAYIPKFQSDTDTDIKEEKKGV